MDPEPVNEPPPNAVAQTNWWVYVLHSETTGLTYTGATTNLTRRMRQHNGELVGGARFTFRGRPWKVLHLEGPMAKVAALQREYAIKQMPRERKLALGSAVTTQATRPGF
jgi:putative endonuclease